MQAIFITMLLCLLVLLPSKAIADKNSILIAHQNNSNINQELINQLKGNSKLASYNVQHQDISNDNLNTTTLNRYQLIIAIGSKTSKSLLDAKISAPVLSLLMPRHLNESFKKLYKDKKNWSSLIIDHPIDRHFHLISSIMGKHKKVAVLLGPYTKDQKKTLKNAARKTQQRLVTEIVDDPAKTSSSLKKLNNTADVLLTLPDPVIYNKKTIRGILLTSYRKKLPITGFSKAYVKAGAIAAVYSRPEQISQQAAVISDNFLISNNFEQRVYFPDDFSVALNRKLARSLGINMKSDSAIIKKIKKAERKK